MLAASSFLTGDIRAGSVIVLMVILGVVLRFVQESRADTAAAKLRAMISVRATVLRDGKPQEEPIGHLVPGDVVELSAGDMIPADVRLISCKDFFLTQASLTGEAFPVETRFVIRSKKRNERSKRTGPILAKRSANKRVLQKSAGKNDSWKKNPKGRSVPPPWF